jgi:Family of unknown function (DUF6011)
MIKCAHCKERHNTVAEVRDCAGEEANYRFQVESELRAEKAAERYWEEGPHGPVDDPHERMLQAMDDARRESYTPVAIEDRDRGMVVDGYVPNRLDNTREHEDQLAARLPELEHGRYAIDIDGVTKFYRVDKPTQGKWAGYTFVKVQASDETHPIRNRAQRIRILSIIAADPQGALQRYGREIGSCGHCGRTLTDQESRERGIGPICWGKLGW